MKWLALALLALSGFAQEQEKEASPQAPAPQAESDERAEAQRRRVEMNLLGAADTEGGESRRNENIQFNLVDNNALKEMNLRVGVSATVIREFRPERGYFGAEFGNQPTAPLHVAPQRGSGFHGQLRWAHLNSVSTARAFFQVGDVQPARENDYGFQTGMDLGRRWRLSLDGGQLKIRGQVNGNVLVPLEDERTALATDPAVRRIVERYLAAYPAQLPNRTDINPRALNTNAPQNVNHHLGGARLESLASSRDRLIFAYNFNEQDVEPFQFVAGQNPTTRVKSHRARVTWNRQWGAATLADFSAGFDRLNTVLTPEHRAVGPMVMIAGLTMLGPAANIPIDRASNTFRQAASVRHTAGNHSFTAGADVIRRQLNGLETDAHRGFFSFVNDFGNDAITNLRLGLPTMHLKAIGNVHRGFRNWEFAFYAGDTWRARAGTTVSLGLRFQPVTAPVEVNRFNVVPYSCDCNNFAPTFGLAQRLPGRFGIFRAAGGVQFGEIFPPTYHQLRFSPPGNLKVMAAAPNLADPLGGLAGGGHAGGRGILYALDPGLVSPYAYQYNASWEPELSKTWRLQLAYVGSRQHKLFTMWYLNRARPVPGIPQTSATVNARRPDQSLADYRRVLNGSRGYYDAARVALILPRWRGVTFDAAYWFSKALDLGSSYTNTAYDADARLGRSQSEFEVHRDMKARSDFDQPHAFVMRGAWGLPSFGGAPKWRRMLAAGWSLSGVVLLKQGTPFTVSSGSDAPGYGNVDGNGGDRPNLVDPSILGRTIGTPDTSLARMPHSAFSHMPPTGERGNLGRNTFRRGSIRNVNAAVSRAWHIDSERIVTFRAETVNLTNTPQFAEPGAELANPNFAQITNTLNEGRTFRVGVQFGW
jgi:hypothetical protein